jgi:hypothetical protein
MLRMHDFAFAYDDLACESCTSMRSTMPVHLNRTYVFSWHLSQQELEGFHCVSWNAAGHEQDKLREGLNDPRDGTVPHTAMPATHQQLSCTK